jgi:signal transduction histidine kinase
MSVQGRAVRASASRPVEAATSTAPRPHPRLFSAPHALRFPRSRRLAWVLAVVAPVAITAALLPFRSDLGLGGVLFCLLICVVVVAGIGGVRPALLAVVVGFAAGVIVFSSPFGSVPIDRPVDLVALVAFVVVGGAVGILVDDLTRLAADLDASRARIVAAADGTRRQIERDLHDGAQQRLVTLGLELRAAQASVPPELTDLDRELSRVVRGLAAAQDELREIAAGIHPAILAEGGLGPALKSLARRSSLPVELDVRTGRLPERIEVAAYFVVAETLTNAAKHAGASVVHIGATQDARALRVTVADDGAGGADPARGSGLVGLQDRVGALGGTISFSSPPGGGTTVRAVLPLF